MHLRTLNGWIYFTTALDLFDRKVIGWALSANLDTANTSIPAFEMAVKNRAPQKDLIFILTAAFSIALFHSAALFGNFVRLLGRV